MWVKMPIVWRCMDIVIIDNHINIEIQVKASSGKYKPKWNFHMILDNLGEVSDSFATGIWTKK